jgi:hypothetical protein
MFALLFVPFACPPIGPQSSALRTFEGTVAAATWGFLCHCNSGVLARPCLPWLLAARDSGTTGAMALAEIEVP